MKIRFAAVAAVSLTGVLAPSAMGAALVSDLPCYREGARAAFLGTGFPPGQPVAVSIDGQQIGTQPADFAGRVGGAIPSLSTIPRSEQTRMLTMSQVANPALRAVVAFRETKVYVVLKPREFQPGKRFRIRAGGFYGVGRTLYAHVRGPTRRNLRIGKLKGPCGKVSATKKQLSKRGDRLGRYTVQFDTVRKYIGRRVPLGIRRTFTVFRRFRFSRSSALSSPVLGGPTRWEPDA